jgi:hypothetical protein
MMTIVKLSVVLAALLSVTSAQTNCSSSLRPSYSATVASGYQIGLVATGLARPRGIQFDKAGNLLVVEAPKVGESAISALTLHDSGGICIGEASRKAVVRGQAVGGSPSSKHSYTHVGLR